MFALKNLVSRIIRYVIKKIKSTLRIINIKILKKKPFRKIFYRQQFIRPQMP